MNQDEVLAIVRAHPGHTATELADLVEHDSAWARSIYRQALYGNLVRLRKYDLVERRANNGRIEWRATE